MRTHIEVLMGKTNIQICLHTDEYLRSIAHYFIYPNQKKNTRECFPKNYYPIMSVSSILFTTF